MGVVSQTRVDALGVLISQLRRTDPRARFTTQQRAELAEHGLGDEHIEALQTVCHHARIRLDDLGSAPNSKERERQLNRLKTACAGMLDAIEGLDPELVLQLVTGAGIGAGTGRQLARLLRLLERGVDQLAARPGPSLKAGRRQVLPLQLWAVGEIDAVLKAAGIEKRTSHESGPFRLVCDVCWDASGLGAGAEKSKSQAAVEAYVKRRGAQSAPPGPKKPGKKSTG